MGIRPRTGATGFTLIELLVVIAIIGVLAALLLPTLTAVRCRSKEGASQAIIRDMESAIKAYESDYAGYPRDNNSPAAGASATLSTVHNNLLVYSLARPGARGRSYYGFKREYQHEGEAFSLSAGIFVDLLVVAGTAFWASWPCYYSPLAPIGSVGVENVNMFYYNENQRNPTKTGGPRTLFNPFTFDMWTGSCISLGPPGAGLQDEFGGASVAGQNVSQINNWK
mgnify:CR=1 FL=1